MSDIAKLCGYRIYPHHFTKIRFTARKLKIKEAEALRRMIEAYTDRCKYCDGKGYGTQTLFYTSRRSSVKAPTMVFCKCERGKQLKSLIKESAPKN